MNRSAIRDNDDKEMTVTLSALSAR